MNKKALVIEGGGSRGVFSFGVIDSFIKRSFNPFDLHLGVSNGAVVQLWYLLRESDYNLDKMLFSASKKYINYKNIFSSKGALNFEGLYREADRLFPIDLDRLEDHMRAKEFLLVTSDALSRRAEYIVFNRENYIDQLLASAALPLLVKKPVIIQGKRKFDGGITDPLPVSKAYELGAREIVVIRTRGERFLRKTRLENRLAAMYLRKHPEMVGALLKNAEVYNEAVQLIENPPDDCRITQICPPENYPLNRTTMDVALMKFGYQLGLGVGADFLRNYSY